MTTEKQITLLGAEPDRALLESFELTRLRGYAVCVGEINSAATNLAARLFEFYGALAGAVLGSGPTLRLTESDHDTIGKLIVRTVQELSPRMPPSAGPQTPP